jgi:Tfp pilus assembly protein PilO
VKLINNIKNLHIFSIVIPILVLFTVVYFFLLPAIQKDNLLSAQIRKSKTDLGVAQAPIKEYAALKEDIKKKNSELAEIKQRLFWERDISKFLNELTRLASELQIEFVSLKPETMPPEQEEGRESDKKKPKKLTSVPITVAFKSNYNEIISFLKRIEEGERFIRIDSLSIESEPSNIYKHLTKVKLNIFIEKGG